MLTTLTRATLAAALLGSAGMAAAQDYTLRAVANSNENDEDYDGLIVFENYVEQASNGAIEVEIFMGTQICSNGAECMQGVGDGNIDIYQSTSGGVSGIFPFVQVLDLPYLMSSDRVAEAALDNGTEFITLMQDMTEEMSGGVVKLMTIGNTGGWRSFANTERQVQTPADLEGMRLRTVVADLPQELVNALGASPTPIPWPELFTSLQTGVVEGTANGITDIMSMKFNEAGLTYLTLDQHSYMGSLWFMNGQVFNEMSPELQRVVVDGFHALQQATFASPKRKSIQAYQEFADAGGEVYVPTPEEKQAFADAAQPVYEWFNGNVDGGQDVYDALVSTVETVEQEIEEAREATIQ